MIPKSERFEMRLDQETLDNLDSWRSQQENLPSRAETIRRLINLGLNYQTDTPIRFSDGEKLIILMLCDIYKALNLEGDFDPSFIASAIHGGHLWGLDWEYVGIYHSHEDNRQVVKEVVDVLEMWTFIENGYNQLSKKDKNRIEKEAQPFGNNVKFIGFDGNYESEHLGVARFLIEKMNRFSNFKDRDLNSHMPTVDSYRRMLNIFEPMRNKLIGGELSAADIIKLLKELVHPQHRKDG